MLVCFRYCCYCCHQVVNTDAPVPSFGGAVPFGPEQVLPCNLYPRLLQNGNMYSSSGGVSGGVFCAANPSGGWWHAVAFTVLRIVLAPLPPLLPLTDTAAASAASAAAAAAATALAVALKIEWTLVLLALGLSKRLSSIGKHAIYTPNACMRAIDGDSTTQVKRRVSIVPVKDTRDIRIYWPMPPIDDHFRSKPAR